MTKAEKIAEAFGMGFARGLVAGKDGPSEPEPAALPPVIPIDSIRAVVHEILDPLIAEDEAPRGDQLDMFTHGIEHVEPDEDAERIRLRVEEARLRREEAAQTERVRPGEWDPNMPNASPWTSPQRE